MRLSLLVVFICHILFTSTAFSDNLKREINLSGKWKFHTGDNEEYAKSNYDDSSWNHIYVPQRWEDSGYENYNGMAWYRIKVFIPKALDDRMLFLKLGCIDDADCVYLNGQYIGSTGKMHDKSSTAWTKERNYPIDHSLIRFGKENIIAVQVWDNHSSGGIRKGSIGIYSLPTLDVFLNLTGKWKVQMGDRKEYRESDFNDNQWEEVNVPSSWSNLGWSNIDRFVWYRKQIHIPSSLKDEKLVMVLGRIDNSDRVYVNGTLIGTTGNMPETKGPHGDDSRDEERVYYLPNHLIEWNRNNVIAVQVYNHGERGGIYSGPLGITSQKVYLEYLNN